MIRRNQYLTQPELECLELTCDRTLRRRKDRVKRILGFFLGGRFRSDG